MSEIFTALTDEDDIRQGDIIKKTNAEGSGFTYGFILTADCDIAQSKAKNHYTWLEIATVKDYLERVWSYEHIEAFVKKHGRVVCDQLVAALRKKSPELTALDLEGLIAWLQASNAAAIIEVIYGQGALQEALASKLTALEILIKGDGEKNQIQRLEKAYKLYDLKAEALHAEARKALSSGGGFPDFFQVPELPNTEGYGFVVMLRHIMSADGKSIFRSQLDARITDAPNSFYRIGRFNDAIRFAISQKLSFLFSRIGMKPNFERDCSESLGIALDEVFNAGAINGN